MPQVQQYDWSKLKPSSPDLEENSKHNSKLADIGTWKNKARAKFDKARASSQRQRVQPTEGPFLNP